MKKTRKEAIESGEPFYLTGKPCLNGHVAPRYTVDGACKECRVEYARKDRAMIKERIKQKQSQAECKNA